MRTNWSRLRLVFLGILLDCAHCILEWPYAAENPSKNCTTYHLKEYTDPRRLTRSGFFAVRPGSKKVPSRGVLTSTRGLSSVSETIEGLTAEVLNELNDLGVAGKAADILVNVDGAGLVRVDQIEDLVDHLGDVGLHLLELLSGTGSAVLFDAKEGLDLEAQLVLGQASVAVLVEGVERGW